MNSVDLGSLSYLGILLAVLLFWFVMAHRGRLGKAVQQAMAWVLIFVGAIAAVGLWEDIRGDLLPRQTVFAEEGRITLPRAPDGHYYAELLLNDVPVRFVVDTGATAMVLTKDDADRAGLNLDGLAFLSTAMTANGAVKTAPVTLDSVRIGSIEDRNFRAFVNGGELHESLLGMTYLQRFSRLEISDGVMILER